MADGSHFENRYIAISQCKIIRLTWSKNEKVALDRLRVRQNAFLVLKQLLAQSNDVYCKELVEKWMVFFWNRLRTLQRRPKPWETGTSAAFSQWHARNWEAWGQATQWSDWHVLWNWHCKTYARSGNTDETVACFTVFVMQCSSSAEDLHQLCLYQDWTM